MKNTFGIRIVCILFLCMSITSCDKAVFEEKQLQEENIDASNLSRVSIDGIYESRPEMLFRITHDRNAFWNTVEVSPYGYPTVHLDKYTPYYIPSLLKVLADTKESITEQERSRIISEARKNTVNKERFNTLFEQWKKDWATNPKTMFNSDTRDCKVLPEFAELLKMGDAIIPLLIEKLMDSEANFVGLVLYDELQKNENLKITYSANDIKALEGEQQRAIRTCKKWVEGLNK